MSGTSHNNVYSIAAGTAFVDALAAGVLKRFDADPEGLAETHILLPTRRACRALGEAFLRATDGKATLLPMMTPIGDIDEDEIGFSSAEELRLSGIPDLPPAMPTLRRQLLLARMIMARDDTMSAAHAARLANELSRFIDEVQTERLSFADFEKIVPERFSQHWQETLMFLQIVTEYWPAILAENGCLDPADRRNRLVAAQIALWQQAPPAGPVIAAGSTGSIPATADLLSCVAELETGLLILPGLDKTLDADSLAALGPSHPQYGMVRLLRRIDVEIQDVVDWHDPSHTLNPRIDAVNGALRPPATAATISLSGDFGDIATAFADVRRIDCPGPQVEALAIAMLLREALEDEKRTAALITPDRRLARRVAAELRRWGVDIDDSGGTPLADTLPGVFLRLTADAVAADAAPVQLLAALKHPLAAGGLNPIVFRDRVREMELKVLRGPRPIAGFEGLRDALVHIEPEAAVALWSRNLAEMARPFSNLMHQGRVQPSALLEAHIKFAEMLSASESETGVERLWMGEAGESAAVLINDLCSALETLPPLAGHEWPALLDALMTGAVVRPLYGRHPRLSIWGLLEARLQQADLMILGGLNEAVWPPDPTADPWMSRPMRSAFGLAPPERRIGLTAHDFVQGFAAPEVVLTRSTRIDGSPTVPARWLTRLETLLSVNDSGMKILAGWKADEARWMQWQSELDSRRSKVEIRAPAPHPPIAARPDRLSVTDIETLIRDPYAIYAKRILGLSALDVIDADPGAADRGLIIHNAIDRFLGEIAGDLPPNALDILLRIGAEEFAPWLDRPGMRAFWWPRFERIAEWIVLREVERSPEIVRRFTETQGLLELTDRVRPFRLSARADRVDQLSEGGYEIIDYKTGAVPSKKDVTAGLSPQLSLEAAMIRAGAFPDIDPGEVAALTYWKLSGGDPAGKITSAGDTPDELAEQALAGLTALLDYYDDPKTVYLARPDADIAPHYSDFDHLERVQEWAVAGSGE
ncbi:MAG: double-strand break repair protein AddB [Rhodospirillaceae bacterium]|nr:double-strand break repair protein AddB [Rhodospirillaceae bacterium]